MRRYIDTEAFYEELRKETAGYSKQEQRSGEDYSWIWRKEFYHVFNNFPAADVKEVVHGRWLEHQEGRWIYAKCSVCNSVQNTKTNYCKDCGAKMDLEVTE